MAGGQPSTGKNTGLTIEQLICWCATHNIELGRDTKGVTAHAYDRLGDIITRCSVLAFRDTIPDQEADLPNAIKVCDLIAEELLILKPSVAWKLNQ